MKPARGAAAPADGVTVELGRLFEEAITCLRSTDLSGANAALKRVHAEVASPRHATGTAGYVGAAPGGHETEKVAEDRR